MKRENSLRQKLRSLVTLTEAVNAMKSLSAHHLRTARAALAAARDYREGIDQAMATIALHQKRSASTGAAILLIASDLGLCGAYNSQLTNHAIEQHQELSASRLYCVGGKPSSLFRKAGISVDRRYDSPSSIAGLSDLLLNLAEDILGDYMLREFDRLKVVSAQFEGVGKFSVRSTQFLPIDPIRIDSPIQPSDYVSIGHLASITIREYLYIRLYQASLDSLASEHGARLVATESAGEWLTEKTVVARRQLAATRREAATQEVLDIAATAKHRNDSR